MTVSFLLPTILLITLCPVWYSTSTLLCQFQHPSFSLSFCYYSVFHVSTQVPEVIELSLHFTENLNFWRCGQDFPGQRVAKIQIVRISPDSNGAKRFSKYSLLQARQRKDLTVFCNLYNWKSVPGVQSPNFSPEVLAFHICQPDCNAVWLWEAFTSRAWHIEEVTRNFKIAIFLIKIAEVYSRLLYIITLKNIAKASKNFCVFQN